MAADAGAIITSMTAQRHHISFTATCSPVSWFGQTMSDNLINIFFSKSMHCATLILATWEHRLISHIAFL